MGQPLVIRRRLGPMSDMRDQRLQGVRLNWNLAHITHPHTRHPSLITVATKRTFRRFVTLSLPHSTPISHLLTPSQPHNNPPLLSRLLPLTSRLLNREPRFLLPEVRVQWVWLHTGRGVATRDLLSWWRDTISDSVYVCFIHSLAFEMNSTKVQNPRRNSYAGTGCRHLLLRYPLHMRV